MTTNSELLIGSRHKEKERLLKLLMKYSFEKKYVILSSGKESDFFIDCKQTILLAEGHYLVGKIFFDTIVFNNFTASVVAGVELGGCPIASAVAMESYERGCSLNALYVRKDVKNHGSKRVIEGILPKDGTVIVLLEDVVTTGTSSLKAVDKLVDNGYIVEGVIALVDRLKGGREAIEAKNLKFVSIFTKEDFISSIK
jgi:orotate phosphoribosyltransferase